MEIQGLQALYAGHKSVKALAKALQDGSARTIFAEGLCVGRSFAVQQCGRSLSAGDGLSVCFRAG